MTNVLWTDGFDVYSASAGIATRYGANVNASVLSYAAGRFGGQCLQLGGGYLAAPITATSTLCTGFAWNNYNTLGAAPARVLYLMSGGAAGNVQCSLAIDNTGKLYVYSGALGTLLGSSAAGVVSVTSWTYIECEVVIGASGSFNVYCNGAQVLVLASVNTKGYAGATTADTVELITPSALTYYVDDWYVGDAATRLGECRIETLRPSSDSSVSWTPNSGANNYSRVNEAQCDGDTSYVSSSTPGQIDLYGIGAMSGTPASIFAVQNITIARKDDTATRQVRSKLKSSATTANGATQTLGSSYAYYTDLHTTDPNTGAAWTAAGVNAALIGVEEIA